MSSVECGSCRGIGAINMDSGWRPCERCQASGKLEIELDPSHFGKYGFVCSSCDVLHFFKGNRLAEKKLAYIFDKGKKMRCPSCGHDNDIDEKDRRMIK